MALFYPFGAKTPDFGCVTPVTPDIAWLRMPLPLVLNHVNIWLIAEGDDWVTVDTGLAWEKGKATWEDWLKTHTLKRQVITHHHPDHMGLAGWLNQKTGAEIWMSQAEYLTGLAFSQGAGSYCAKAQADFFCRHGLDAPRLKRFQAAGEIYQNDITPPPKMFHRLSSGQTVRIGGFDWQVITGVGHAVEHVSLYCAERKLLLAGDMLLPGIASNIPVMPSTPFDNPLKDYLSDLTWYLSLPPDTLVLPAHGRPFTGAANRANALASFHRRRLDMLLSNMQKPVCACDLLPLLFNWGEMDAHQLMFAMGEAIACLHYLEGKGKIKRMLQSDGIIRFQHII